MKRKKMIRYLKLRRDVFTELVKHVDNGEIQFPEIHPDKSVQINWIKGRINLLEVLICDIESKKGVNNYIKVVDKHESS